MAKLVGVDKWMFFITVVLLVAGLAVVFSATVISQQESHQSPYTFVVKQAIWGAAGMAALLILMHIDYSLYNSKRFIGFLVIVTVGLLASVYFFPASHNTHRWIRFGQYFTFQPSEIAKPVLVLFLARFLHSRIDKIDRLWRTLAPAAGVAILFTALVVFEPDLGTALVLAGVTALLLVLAGAKWRFLFGGALAASPGLAALLYFVAYRRSRMFVFMHPDADPQGAGFHINQSLIAIGAGGLTGRGFMEGMQKLFFLPEAHTDFIFANIAEELGFAGSVTLLLLFIYFGYRGMRAGFRSQDPFARLVAFGITATIVLQALFNISVALALLPTKGIPLPLISSGGTSLFCTLASIGVLLNITKKVD